MTWRITFIFLAALLLLGLGSASTAQAELTAVGPINPANGYPLWYEDSSGLRLGLCLDQGGACLLENPNPGEPISFPDNFGPEAFWWSAEADMVGPNGERLLLVLALESAFGGAEEIVDGNQIAFGRVRIRLEGVTPGAEFTVTHPYGRDVVQAEDDRGRARMTEDIGCATPCDFTLPLTSRVGPFLRCVDPAPPEGSVGDLVTACTVTGSPTGNNFFRVEGPGIDQETDLFSVTGMLFDPTLPLPPPLPVKGDSDGDNSITIADALLVAQCVAGLAGPCSAEADVDGDGQATIADALLIAQFVAGLTPAP